MYVSSTGQNEWLGHCHTEDVAIQVGRQFCGHFLGPHRAEWRPAGGGRRQGHDRRMRSRANDRTAEKPSEMDYLGSIEKRHGNTYVPALISSENLACFLASIMYNPVLKTECSISSQIYPPLITADPMDIFNLFCIGPSIGSE